MRAVHREPLLAFFILAYALSWACVLAVPLSFGFALLALFGPAAAAVVVSAVTEGRAGVRQLVGRVAQWRVGARWYLVALLLPFALTLAAAGLLSIVDRSLVVGPTGSPWLALTLGVLVLGEELGWRGFALPRLQARLGGLGASLVLGILWAAWHLPNATIRGLEHYWSGFPAFLLYVIAQTILFTWIANHSGGSLLLAWLFHAAINIAGSTFYPGDPVRQWWSSAITFGITALVVVLRTGPNLSPTPLTAQPTTPAAEPQ